MSTLLILMLTGQQFYQMDEVVVTANRYPLLLQDVAVAVMIIEREEIEKMEALSLSEILSACAGIDIKDYGTAGVTSISTRGIPSTGTLVLVDGQPLNTITNGMADLSAIHINTIERIEIVKGPVSSIYGANALGGVVNIITARTSTEPQAEIGFIPSTTSSDSPLQKMNAFLRLGLPLGNDQFSMVGAWVRDDGARSNSDMSDHHITGAIAHNTNPVTLRASILYDNKEYGIPGPLPLINDTNPIPLFGDSTANSLFDRQKDHTLMGNIVFDLHLLANVDYYAGAFANRQRTEFHTVYPGMIGDTVAEDYDYLVHKLGFNTMITRKIDAFDYVFGLDVHYDTLRTIVNSEPTNDTTWTASSHDFGVWGEWRMHINDRFSLNSSIRYDNNSQFGGFLSPGVGFVGILNPRLWLKLSAGKTFRAPTFNDLYWPLYGNPDLKPEHGWAYELRLESSPIPALFGALSLFTRNIVDRIAWMPGSGNIWQPQNLNYLSINGLDIELSHYIHESVNYTIGFTYLHARQKNDEIVYDYYDWIADTTLTIIEEVERKASFTPKYSLSLQLNMLLSANIRFNVNGQYVSKRLNYYPNYVDYPYVTMDEKSLNSYVVMNTALTADISGYFALSIGIKNILGTDYATQFGNTVYDLDYPMPGRTYFIRFSLHSQS
jgi:outer membrane cobalamin receptor